MAAKWLTHHNFYEGAAGGGVRAHLPRTSRRFSVFTNDYEQPSSVSLSIGCPVDPSFRALFGRLKFMVPPDRFNKDSFSLCRKQVRLGGLCGPALVPHLSAFVEAVQGWGEQGRLADEEQVLWPWLSGNSP